MSGIKQLLADLRTQNDELKAENQTLKDTVDANTKAIAAQGDTLTAIVNDVSGKTVPDDLKPVLDGQAAAADTLADITAKLGQVLTELDDGTTPSVQAPTPLPQQPTQPVEQPSEAEHQP